MSSGKIETREAILEAALELFTARGPTAVRMVDIAKRAGVTRQAVYLHFGSRTGLLVSLAQYVDEKEGLAELAAPVWEAHFGAEALNRFVALNAQYNPRIFPIVKVLKGHRYDDEAIAAAWNDRMDSRRDACRQLVEWVERDGALNPALDIIEATDLLWTLTSIQVWEQLVVDKGWPRERYEQHLRLVLQNTFLKYAPTPHEFPKNPVI